MKLSIGIALALLLSGCEKHMSYDELDATRVNAINALAEAQAAKDRAEQLESDLEDAQQKLADMEAKLDAICNNAPNVCY